MMVAMEQKTFQCRYALHNNSVVMARCVALQRIKESISHCLILAKLLLLLSIIIEDGSLWLIMLIMDNGSNGPHSLFG